MPDPTIGEIVQALDTMERWTHSIKELLKTLPQSQTIQGPGGTTTPPPPPRFTGCDPGTPNS